MASRIIIALGSVFSLMGVWLKDMGVVVVSVGLILCGLIWLVRDELVSYRRKVDYLEGKRKGGLDRWRMLDLTYKVKNLRKKK